MAIIWVFKALDQLSSIISPFYNYVTNKKAEFQNFPIIKKSKLEDYDIFWGFERAQVNITTEGSVMFLSHMKPVYTTSTITRNSNVTKFVQLKMATNKKNKQVNLK